MVTASMRTISSRIIFPNPFRKIHFYPKTLGFLLMLGGVSHDHMGLKGHLNLKKLLKTKKIIYLGRLIKCLPQGGIEFFNQWYFA